MANGEKQLQNESQTSREKGQESIGEARNLEVSAVAMSLRGTYEHSPEAANLAKRMGGTRDTATEYFGHNAFFDHTGMARDPELSGFRLDDLRTDEKTASLATAIRIAGETPENTRLFLINMRAYAQARDAANAERDRRMGEGGDRFSGIGRHEILQQAEKFIDKATQEIDAEPENVAGCLEECQRLSEQTKRQQAEVEKVNQAIKEKQENERRETEERMRREERKVAKAKLSEILGRASESLKRQAAYWEDHPFGSPTDENS